MSNWCGWEGGFKFSTVKNKISKLPFVDRDKLDKLYYDIETKACNPHDEAFEKWWGILDFIKANRDFSVKVISLLHWTTVIWRLTTFLLLFFWTSTLGIKYFNWGWK